MPLNLKLYCFFTYWFSGKCWLRWLTWGSTSRCINCNHTEQILRSLNESLNIVRNTKWHWSDWITSYSAPTFRCSFFTLKPIACDWSSSICFWLFPVHSHGVYCDARECWLLALARWHLKNTQTLSMLSSEINNDNNLNIQHVSNYINIKHVNEYLLNTSLATSGSLSRGSPTPYLF